MYNTDGNLAAIEAHIREFDYAQTEQDAIRDAQQEFADDLYDAYVLGKQSAIDEVNDLLTEDDEMEAFIRLMREAIAKEVSHPVVQQGPILFSAYQSFISEVCEKIAQRKEDLESVDDARRDLGL